MTMLFDKKRGSVQGHTLSERCKEGFLPAYGLRLETYLTTEYRLNLPEYLEECLRSCKENVSPLVEMSDEFTEGDAYDAFVDSYMEHIKSVHEQDIASHEQQAERIKAGREVRKQILEQNICERKKEIDRSSEEIAGLRNLRAQHELKIGEHYLPIGILVTVFAMVIDGLLNYSFLEGVFLSNAYLLFITVLGLSVLSDGSMFCLATFLSDRDVNMNRKLYYFIVGAFTALFILSAVACVCIKFGSMDVTFGSISADGSFVGKESYSLSEYAATAVTAAITTCTGLISFAFSLDRNAPLVNRRRILEKRLQKDLMEYENLCAEKEAINNAADPIVNDLARRKVAERNLEVLSVTMKHEVRKMLAIHQKDAGYADAMAESARRIFKKESPEEILGADLARKKTTKTITKNIKLEEAV